MQMQKPHFTLIVPVYNTETFLPRCVESILDQDFTDYELILVDDGSPDNCPALCDAYAEQYSHIRIIHQENGGVSCARNAALEIARGDWIWFIDSDDFILPESLKRIYEIQNKIKSDIYIFNENIEEYFDGDINNFLELYYFTYIVKFAPWDKIYKRSIIANNKLKFDKEETIGEDLIFNLNYYIFISNAYFIKETFYIYDVRDGSAITSYSKTRHINLMRLFLKAFALLKGRITSLNIGILYFMHLVSGLNQSREGGISLYEYAKLAEKYKTDFPGDKNLYKKSLSAFLHNEKSSFTGQFKLKFLLNISYISNSFFHLFKFR